MAKILLFMPLIFSWSFTFADNVDCSKIKITKVHILKEEPNDGYNHQGCFADNNPCFVEITDGKGETKKFPFLSSIASDKDDIGFSWQCSNTDLDSKGMVSDLKLPTDCTISIKFARKRIEDSRQECECNISSCKKYEDPRFRDRPQQQQSGEATR